MNDAQPSSGSIGSPAFWWGIVLFLLGQVFLWLSFPYLLTASDSVHYLLMSEELAQGRFYDWLSGHWSPLLSILLLPFQLLPIDPFLSFRILNGILGLLLVRELFFCSRILRFPESWMPVFWVAVLPLLSLMPLLQTPDLLLVLLLFFYLRTLEQVKDSQGMAGWIKVGLIGGLLYWSKSIGLYFFLAHLILWFFIRIFKKEQALKATVAPFLLSVATALIVVGIYAIPLSLKFDRFTIGTAGQYNFALIGETRNYQQLSREELVDPRSEYTSLWAYEEPAEFVDGWSPLSSSASRRHYLNHVKKNLTSLYYNPFVRDGLALLLVFVFTLFAFRGRYRKADWGFPLSIMLMGLLVLAAYGLLIVQPRYVWSFDLAAILVIFYFIFQLKDSRIMTFWVIAISILFMINGVREGQLWVDHPSFFRELRMAEKEIPEDLLKGKRVAILDLPKQYYLMEGNAYLLWHQRFEFWGQYGEETLPGKGFEELKNNSIDYLIIWNKDTYGDRFSPGVEPVFESEEADLSIYPLKE